MPRIGRTILQYYPHHVVQRGHNRQAVFAEPGDYERYLQTLVPFKEVYGVKVYAYCLMANHVHLDVIPKGEWSLIREVVQRGQLTGTGRFVDKVEEILGKHFEKRAPGRSS